MNGNSEPTGKINGQSIRKLPDFLTLPQAADALQVSTMTLRRAYHRGELKAFLIGCSLRIRRTDLEAWIEGQKWSPQLCAQRTSRRRAGNRKRKGVTAVTETPGATPGSAVAQ